jgi:SMC interacting uncharacterized protein involved in chromosome segregation
MWLLCIMISWLHLPSTQDFQSYFCVMWFNITGGMFLFTDKAKNNIAEAIKKVQFKASKC